MTTNCHYIPCLWSAFWNLEYHNNSAYRKTNKARQQVVYSFNIIGNKIIKTKVENVFFEKKMSLDILDKSIMLDFIKRNMPEQENNFRKETENDFGTSILDYEGYFTALDNSISEPIIEIILSKSISNISQKTEISYLIATTLIRNFKNINTLSILYAKNKMPKFELFWHLTKILTDPDAVMKLTFPFLSSKWILHKSKTAKIPLSDQPFIQRKNDILFTLSPYLLIQIFPDIRVLPTVICEINENVSQNLLNELSCCLVETAEREIISHNEDYLNELKDIIKSKKQN